MLSRFLACMILCVTCSCFTSTVVLAQPAVRSDFKIDGRLVDIQTNQPVARARVAVASVTQRDAFTTVITAEDGLFSFSGLKAGKYSLSAQAHGYVFQAFNQHDQYSSSIAVGPDTNSSGLMFRIARENAIEGTITDEAGEPVRSAQIMLYQTGIAAGTQATRLRTQGITDDQGGYHLGHLPAGDYLLSVEGTVWYAQRPQHRGVNYFPNMISVQSGSISSVGVVGLGGAMHIPSEPDTPNPLDLAYPLTYFPGVTEAASASVIHLTRGEKFVADLTLQPRPAIHMKIPAAGTPESPANYRLERKMPDGSTRHVMSEVRPLPSGEVEILGVAPGQYTLFTDLHNPVEPGVRKVASSETTSAREINAVGNDVVDEGKTMSFAPLKAKIQLEPGASLASRSFIQLYDFKARRNIFQPIAENHEVEFTQNVPPGSYEISINGGGTSFIRSIVTAGAKVYGRTVVIRGATPLTLEITIAKGEALITGVALRDGQPLAGVMIVAVPSDPRHNQVLFRRDQSDSDGTFMLPNVVPGDYTVLAIENGWELQWTKPEILKPYLPLGDALKVEQNGNYSLKLKVQ